VAVRRGYFGPSSLHYSASSFPDRFVLPDLGAMRVQFALDALCSDGAWEPPCGIGRDMTEQVNLVHDFHPQCQCNWVGLSNGDPVFCNDDDFAEWRRAKVETRTVQDQLVLAHINKHRATQKPNTAKAVGAPTRQLKPRAKTGLGRAATASAL
jgi:hypothetical protein